jgi:aerobic-type carbon monoxide dehydrogenase small subunit (CoxS/CutS family)
VLREQLGLTGTKYGCGVAQCGACTVHIDGVPDPQLRAAGVQRRPNRRSPPSRACRPTAQHPVQKAWVALDVPQCGYCQSGMVMAAAALLKRQAPPHRRRHRRGDHQHLPLRHLQPGARRDQGRDAVARPRGRADGHDVHVAHRRQSTT